MQPCLLALCGSVTARGAGAELAASGLQNLVLALPGAAFLAFRQPCW